MPSGKAAAIREAVAKENRADLQLERTPWGKTGFVNVVEVKGKYQARLQVPQTVSDLLQSVQPHVWALIACTRLIHTWEGNKRAIGSRLLHLVDDADLCSNDKGVSLFGGRASSEVQETYT